MPFTRSRKASANYTAEECKIAVKDLYDNLLQLPKPGLAAIKESDMHKKTGPLAHPEFKYQFPEPSEDTKNKEKKRKESKNEKKRNTKQLKQQKIERRNQSQGQRVAKYLLDGIITRIERDGKQQSEGRRVAKDLLDGIIARIERDGKQQLV